MNVWIHKNVVDRMQAEMEQMREMLRCVAGSVGTQEYHCGASSGRKAYIPSDQYARLKALAYGKTPAKD